MKRSKGNIEGVLCLILLVIMLFVAGVKTAVTLTTRETHVAQVTEKAERCKSRDSCKYLIFTDAGVFENTDSWLAWKFDSSDVYNDLKVGHTYKIQTQGIRVGFFSWYPNVIGSTEVRVEK